MIDVLLAFIQCFTNFLITYLFLTGIFAHRFQNTYVSITIVAIHSLLLALSDNDFRKAKIPSNEMVAFMINPPFKTESKDSAFPANLLIGFQL